MIVLVLALAAAASAQTSQQAKPGADAVIWQDPGDIRSLNLFWGPGGEKHQPQPPVAFVEEDMHGTSPKFEVRDSNDKKWKAKLGLEAKPETAASRLLWAVGYGANENYFLPQLQVTNMPATLKRGSLPAMAGLSRTSVFSAMQGRELVTGTGGTIRSMGPENLMVFA